MRILVGELQPAVVIAQGSDVVAPSVSPCLEQLQADVAVGISRGYERVGIKSRQREVSFLESVNLAVIAQLAVEMIAGHVVIYKSLPVELRPVHTGKYIHRFGVHTCGRTLIGCKHTAAVL